LKYVTWGVSYKALIVLMRYYDIKNKDGESVLAVDETELGELFDM